MRRLLSLLALALAACSSSTTPPPGGNVPTNLPTSSTKLDANDVSILMPLPTTMAAVEDLLAATAVGTRGELLPLEDFTKEMGALTLYPEDNGRDKLRVVAARFDPCFPRLVSDPSKCQAQLRLVMQPVILSSYDNTVRAVDAAIHVFYTFERPEFVKMLGEMAAVKDASSVSTAGALAPNPAITAEGLTGAYAKGLRAVILAHAGASAISRITFTQLTGSANVWIWGGVDRKNGVLTPMGIAGTKTTSQRLDNNFLGEDIFGVDVVPALDEHDDTLVAFKSNDVAMNGPISAMQKAVDSMVLMENPDKITADEGTCASCHVATPFRLWAERNRGLKTDTNPNLFSKTVPQTSPAALKLDSVRAFGWRERDFAVSQRVANETVGVVEYLPSIR
ncbi:hypothetical protein BH09MYX1_BH09MYX1_12740 [soil metagenome]